MPRSTRRALTLVVAVLALLAVAVPATALAANRQAAEQDVLHAEIAQRATERRLERAEAALDRLQDRHEEAVERIAEAVDDLAVAIEAAHADVDAARADVEDAAKASRVAQRALNAAVLRSTWEAGQPGSSGLLWPTDGEKGSPFGYRTHPISGQRRLHAGTDIPAPTGTPILAVEAGKVVSASTMRGYGKTVLIDHGDGKETLYAHASKLDVEKGDRVAAGDQIARVGSTGQSTGPHLHFELRVDGKPVDPMSRY